LLVLGQETIFHPHALVVGIPTGLVGDVPLVAVIIDDAENPLAVLGHVAIVVVLALMACRAKGQPALVKGVLQRVLVFPILDLLMPKLDERGHFIGIKVVLVDRLKDRVPGGQKGLRRDGFLHRIGSPFWGLVLRGGDIGSGASETPAIAIG